MTTGTFCPTRMLLNVNEPVGSVVVDMYALSTYSSHAHAGEPTTMVDTCVCTSRGMLTVA
jgi:hypothetical protein